MADKTVCRYCDKAYVNVLEHVTKSHSWLRIYKYADGSLASDEKVKLFNGAKTALFWKDIEFEYGDCHTDKEGVTHLAFSSSKFQGLVFVGIRLKPNTKEWEAVNIETHVDYAFTKWSAERGSFRVKDYKIPKKFNFVQFTSEQRTKL
jgi:hypothetical protein